MTTVQAVGYLFAVCGGLWAVFYATEQVVSDEYRKDFANRVLGFDLVQLVKEWPKEILKVFDNTFGTKPLTWRFFSRSAACSIGFYILVAIAYTRISPNYEFQDILEFHDILLFSSSFKTVIKSLPYVGSVIVGLLSLFFMLTFALIANAVADYLSLLETRWMIRRLANNPTFRRIVIIILADILVTAIIFVMWSLFWLRIIDGQNPFGGNWWRDAIAITRSLNTTPSENKNFVPFIFAYYTTFATSIWVWANVAGLFFLRLIRTRYNSLWVWLRDHVLDTRQRPFLAVGYATCLCIFIFGGFAITGVAVLKSV